MSALPIFALELEGLTRRIESQMPGEPVREMAWRVCFPRLHGQCTTDHALGSEVERVSAAYAAAKIVAEGTHAGDARTPV